MIEINSMQKYVLSGYLVYMIYPSKVEKYMITYKFLNKNLLLFIFFDKTYIFT